ncbi:unnamed protein product [Clonostachys rosea f. rosea IK726]|uniref:Uncharacterized protein n=1 Tax=Clonostachys rosea f. rosea IK726 TaxID=1349383 RepID=A0ACA9U2R3_BIOOC|nr:unnamed protein product [Clonostachys rosea f. rosea IK726]
MLHRRTNAESIGSQLPTTEEFQCPNRSENLLTEPIAQTPGPSYTQGQERSSVPATTTTPVELLSTYDDTGTAIEDDDALINLFYANFHAAHPILVPRGSYSSQGYPDYLKLVVHFIGGHFSSMASGDQLRSLAGKALEEAFGQTSRTYHLVQGLLLFSVALHARNEIKESVLTLSQAVSVALELGLHKKAFSESILGLGEIEGESLRRTWWELYVTDGFMAALQRGTGSRCHGVDIDVPLPCDDLIYMEGGTQTNVFTLADFDSRIYMDEELQFSSSCYRIEAVRILSRSLAISWTHEVHEDQVQAIDNALAAWPHHLGYGAAEAASTSGAVDEMLFQAHMIIQFTIINLHFPRSDLVAAIPAASDIIRQTHVLPLSSRTMHGIKAIEASKHMSNLAALRVPVHKHTPFFICGIVFGVIVQLSACWVRPARFQEQCRDSVSLIAGVLKTLSPTWALAQVTLRKIKPMALEALTTRARQTKDKTGSPRDSGVDVSPPVTEPQINDLPWLDFFHWAQDETVSQIV